MTAATTLPATRARDAARTREAILRAGQKLFAETGYATTGVREIAAEAGVNSALVRRYFGSKEGLLRAALKDVLRIDPLIEGDRAAFGVRTVALLMQADSIANPVAIMMLSMADRDARDLCCALIHEDVILPLAAWLGGDNALDRAAQLNALWTGFITARTLLPLRQLGDRTVAPTLRWLEQLTQAIADDERGTGGAVVTRQDAAEVRVV